MSIEEAAALAFDTYEPFADVDFEDLSDAEKARWHSVAAALLTRPKREPKLTDHQVAEIRRSAEWCTYAELAERFGVARSTIGAIVRGELRP